MNERITQEREHLDLQQMRLRLEILESQLRELYALAAEITEKKEKAEKIIKEMPPHIEKMQETIEQARNAGEPQESIRLAEEALSQTEALVNDAFDQITEIAKFERMVAEIEEEVAKVAQVIKRLETASDQSAH